jgi:hypothetical protein
VSNSIWIAMQINYKASLWWINFVCLFPSGCKLILYLSTMYVYSAYNVKKSNTRAKFILLTMSKSPIQEPNCLKIAEASVVAKLSENSWSKRCLTDHWWMMLPFLTVAQDELCTRNTIYHALVWFWGLIKRVK